MIFSKFLFLILCCILIFSCGNSESRTIVLRTSHAELTAYIEEFNAIQNNYIVELVYSQEPSDTLFKNSTIPDILIIENINNSGFFSEFDSLNSILNKDRINPDIFYNDLLTLGVVNKNQILLPVNFSLPAIIYKPEAINKEFTNMFISFEQIKEGSLNYSTTKRNRLTKMGFSPLWEPEFLYYSSKLYNSEFGVDINNSLIWQSDALNETIDFFKIWIDNTSENFENELTFSLKYLRIPEYQLIQSGTILFHFSDIKDYLEIPTEKRENLDFRWLQYNDKIPVLDNILFAGIPKQANNKNGARAFLEWFFNRETQVRLLEINHLKRLQGIFGIANGFSSLKEINEKDIHKPEFYPIFVGHIPQEDQFLFPNILPKDWESSIKDIVIQYLEDSIIEQDYEQELSTLLK